MAHHLQTKQILQSELSTVPAGNQYDKYNTRNPLARYLMDSFLASFDELSAKPRIESVLEVGCGEGHLSLRLARRGLRVRASDLSPDIIETARANAITLSTPVSFRTASVYNLDEDDAADMVVCCEVLEHLEHPDEALRIIASLARPWLLVSVPCEPLWRALNILRGRYLADWGNTPGHLQHWSARSFLRFLSRSVDVVEVRRPLPWTMALCKVPESRAGRISGFTGHSETSTRLAAR